jgi:hypothetical protein
MAAQAEILTTMEFAKRFDINPLQGLWPQMMPMNVWVNPGRKFFVEQSKRPSRPVTKAGKQVEFSAAITAQ